ncbi:MAG: hypothetical protein H6813_05230 [Phycisphaeraceae bacterium]|nr:hypothetical protein [Phycisphaeraceae bacterium]MCB9847786.1 hypothetical protein [Phycisphaeraceae bacterium]
MRNRTKNIYAPALATALLAGTAQADIQYSVTDLGPIGGPTTATAPGSVALDCTETGAVAGYSVVMDGQRFLHATIWNGAPVSLMPLPGDDHSAAMAMNEAGTIVGVSYTLGTTQPTAVQWVGGMPSMIGSFTPTAINSAGVAVGSQQTSPLSAVRNGVIWQGGIVSPLGTLGGENSHADDINDNNVIVGWASTPSGNLHAFSFQSGVMHDLGTLGGAVSQARAINESAQVVGYAVNGAGQPHAFLAQLNPDGSAMPMSDLGELGGGSSYAYDINGSGVIVGTSDSRAFVIDGGAMQDLNGLVSPAASWRLDRATGVNDSGQIIGSGAHFGLPRSFLLTPMTMTLAADLNNDGVVDTADLGILIMLFGSSDPTADINGDGVVDTADLGLLLAAFGTMAP